MDTSGDNLGSSVIVDVPDERQGVHVRKEPTGAALHDCPRLRLWRDTAPHRVHVVGILCLNRYEIHAEQTEKENPNKFIHIYS